MKRISYLLVHFVNFVDNKETCYPPENDLDPLDPSGDHVELGMQVDWIPPRVVPEARCYLMNVNELCPKFSTSDPEEIVTSTFDSFQFGNLPIKPDIQDLYETVTETGRATYMYFYNQAYS